MTKKMAQEQKEEKKQFLRKDMDVLIYFEMSQSILFGVEVQYKARLTTKIR